jgi:hypothetical protein
MIIIYVIFISIAILYEIILSQINNSRIKYKIENHEVKPNILKYNNKTYFYSVIGKNYSKIMIVDTNEIYINKSYDFEITDNTPYFIIIEQIKNLTNIIK